jgi:UDP-glucose 4-epimerase
MSQAIALAEEIAGRELALEVLPAARGDVRRTSADVTLARDELGFAPETRLVDGLHAQWEWAAARVGAA